MEEDRRARQQHWQTCSSKGKEGETCTARPMACDGMGGTVSPSPSPTGRAENSWGRFAVPCRYWPWRREESKANASKQAGSASHDQPPVPPAVPHDQPSQGQSRRVEGRHHLGQSEIERGGNAVTRGRKENMRRPSGGHARDNGKRDKDQEKDETEL